MQQLKMENGQLIMDRLTMDSKTQAEKLIPTS